MPYVLAGVNLLNIDGDARNQLAYAGADIRYEPRPNVTGVVSLYPDFNQLEAQVTDIDFSYTEKFRTDPRPFFRKDQHTLDLTEVTSIQIGYRISMLAGNLLHK